MLKENIRHNIINKSEYMAYISYYNIYMTYISYYNI